MKKFNAVDISIGAIFVALMAIGANIAVWFPFLAIPIAGKSVPLSLQTFFAILAGLLLGKRLGSFSMLVYLLIGLAGVPVFAQMKAGLFILLDYTGGFLISFIFVAWASGWIVERMKKATLYTYSVAAIVGVAVNYGIGVTYMCLAMNTWLELSIGYGAAWTAMVPFLIKDFIIAIVAAVIMVRIASRLPKLA
ncbi:biotin transporter BioY [Radiobacillus kanasensis]|uniref:biotin transporter BioY n=1 Tax=Radiobacillus kanasensis TaxID=2844358 RepID=UPI001E3795A5|nr:biotin transporter BioY [Radiobacillus kanasensis]UFT98210.1 biotin transporter BioY [Radiobacillus kanasensis]